MKDYKILKAEFDKETGISTVTIRTKDGEYTGHSKLRAEDIKYASKYVGCRYAEIKANIKAIQDKIRTLKKELSSFEKFYKHIKASKKFNIDSYEAAQIRIKICDLKNKIYILKDKKLTMTNTLLNAIYDRNNRIQNFYHNIKLSEQDKND